MRILYYDWDEFNGEDCRDAMYRLGYLVDVIKVRLPDGGMRASACSDLGERLKRAKGGAEAYDAVFSFDFFPEVSEVCQELGVPYASWVFDCPHYPLYSEKLSNPVNRVHIFDRVLWEELRGRSHGSKIHHTPLAVNADRLIEAGFGLGECGRGDADSGLEGGREEKEISYIHDISFIGNLYDNEFNFYDRAEFPAEIGDYLKDVFEAQQRIFGADILGDKRVIDDDLMNELKSRLSFENTGKFNIDYDRVILDILRKKVTILERRNILEEMGKRFDTVIYTNPDAKEIPNIRNLGLAPYMDKMPCVFHNSRININITMRCIPSGIPLRVVDVLGAGGFLLTSYTREIEENFNDGEELAIARTPEEMLEKAAYYLEHEAERRQIAACGQRKVFERFGYGKVLPQMFSL